MLMKTYIVLLRAVNVGGTGKLPMAELRAMCEDAGFQQVRTYIASGNVVMKSAASEKQVKSALETRLEHYAGKPVGVLVRTGAELASVLAANPFPKAAPNRTVAIFLDKAPPAKAEPKKTAGTDTRQIGMPFDLLNDMGSMKQALKSCLKELETIHADIVARQNR